MAFERVLIICAYVNTRLSFTGWLTNMTTSSPLCNTSSLNAVHCEANEGAIAVLQSVYVAPEAMDAPAANGRMFSMSSPPLCTRPMKYMSSETVNDVGLYTSMVLL